MNERFRAPQVRRAVVLFPSGLTLANLFFGVYAIVTASRGDYERAALWVVLGAIADAFDGRVARATGTGGRFGEELDSLVDAITFGLAPALIAYFAVLNRTGWDWVWAFLFTACAVLRLARFNVVQAGSASKRYFQGLPSPAAGITLASFFWFSHSPLYAATVDAGWPWQQLIRVVMGTLSFLMISNVPYPVVPKLSFRSIEGWAAVVFLVGGVTMLVLRKWEWFFPLATAYLLLGLLRAGTLGWLERRDDRRLSQLPDETVLDLVEADEDVDADIEYERTPTRTPRRRRSTPTPTVAAPVVSSPATPGVPAASASTEEREQARRRRRRRKPRRTGEGPSSSSNDNSPE